jgi:hypothetical protein
MRIIAQKVAITKRNIFTGVFLLSRIKVTRSAEKTESHNGK